VACGALAGAVGSLAHDLVEGGHSWKEMAGNALVDGAIGGVTGGLGAVGGAAIGAGARALGGGLRSAGQAAVSAGRSEVSSIASGRLGGLLGRTRGCNSFAPQTMVLMADGSTKPIEDVRVGDLVLATDPTTGKTESRPVTDLIVGQGEKHMVEIDVDVDGDRGDATGTLTATDGHPFWVPSLHKWVKATDLETGALLRTSAGTYVQVTAVRKWTAQDQRAHNLTVDGLHTYYVTAGEQPVLVHNCGGEIPGHSDKCRCVKKPGSEVDFDAPNERRRIKLKDLVDGAEDVIEYTSTVYDGWGGPQIPNDVSTEDGVGSVALTVLALAQAAKNALRPKGRHRK
ncbi:MAG TPA: polymorphic toxin-type HINT domain-containing protein, partial [Micromonospora sp.]